MNLSLTVLKRVEKQLSENILKNVYTNTLFRKNDIRNLIHVRELIKKKERIN
jgi:hypothetical protein